MAPSSTGNSLIVGMAAMAFLQTAAADELRQLECESQFTPNVSAASLAEDFGAENVAAADIYSGEGSYEKGTALFSDVAIERVEIVWKDPQLQREPRSVRVQGDASHWRTMQGVTLGTDLKTLERINGQPFTLMGFAWDYQGTVVSWSGGFLENPYSNCKMLVRLAPELKDADPNWSVWYERVIGERAFPSNDPAMQELNPKVYAISLLY